MATTPRSTLVTKAQELMNSQGLSYADAAKQARANITPTTPTTPPVTPPAVVPPVTPVPVTPAPQLYEQELRQGMSGASLQERQVMRAEMKPPVTPTTPTPPAPVTPPVTPPTTTPTPTPVKPVEVKPEVDRNTQINQNLTEGFNNNPSLFANYDTYKKAYGYDAKPQEERDQLDAFFQSKIPQDTNTMYQSLKLGGTIPEQAKNSKAYTQAKEKYNIFAKYNSMTPDQLYSSMISNDIGTELSNDLAQNPNYVQAKTKYDAYIKTKSNNDAAIGAVNAVNGVKNEVSNPLDKLNDTITKFKDENTLASYRDYLANEDPELVNDVKKLNEKTQLLQELVDERDDMTRTIIKDTPGISKGAAYALAARRNESLNDQIRTMTYEQNALSADVKYRQGILDKSYEFDQKAYQDSLDFAQQSALAQYQSDLSLETDQAQFEQKLEQQAQLAKDPVTGVQQILKTYADMGILPTRSQQEIITDIENQVAQGIPVETALTNLNKAFQSKPEYTQYMAYQKAKMTPETKSTTDYKVIGKDAQGNDVYGFVNTANQTVTPSPSFSGVGTGADFRTLATKYPNEASLKNNNPAGITWNSNFDKGTGFASILKENGVNFEKGTARPTAEGGNYVTFPTVEDGMKAYDLLWNTDRYQNMTVENALNTWGTGSLNLGPINPNAKISQLTPDQVTQIKNAQLKKESPGFYKELNNLKTAQEDKPLTDKQFTQANQVITSFKSDPQVKAFEEAYSQGMSLVASLNDKTGPGDVAGIFQFMKTLDPASVVRETEFEVAARSAGVAEYIGNTWDRIAEGKKLTDSQAEAFGRLAKQFIADKAKLYDTKYQDGIRRLEKQGIDTSVFPTSTAEQMRQILGSEKTKTTPVNNKYLDIVKNTK